MWGKSVDHIVRQIDADDHVDVRTGVEVVDGGGGPRLEWVDLVDRGTGRRERRSTCGLFIFIGAEPRTEWLPIQIQRDEHGFALTGTSIDIARRPLARSPHPFETSFPGVFAGGDVRAGSVKRVAAAVAKDR